MASTSRVESAPAEQSKVNGVVTGTDYSRAFQELVNAKDDHVQRRLKWEKQRDDSLGPILGQGSISQWKDKERSGQGLSQRERDCLRLKRADEEWIGEARKVVSGLKEKESQGYAKLTGIYSIEAFWPSLNF